MTPIKITCPTCDGLGEIDDWLVKQLDFLREPMARFILAGGKLDNPEYRQQLGQHQAYMRARSFISGARKAGER